jgi:hypothetical protein
VAHALGVPRRDSSCNGPLEVCELHVLSVTGVVFDASKTFLTHGFGYMYEKKTKVLRFLEPLKALSFVLD